MLRPGDTIEYLADVSSPPSQKGIRGQTEIIDRGITMWTARFLLRGGKVRLYDPASPLQLEEEIKKGPDGPAESAGPASTKIKSERGTTNEHRKKPGERNQTSDDGPKKPDSKRRAANRRD